jgi:hypothetical protein
MCGSTCDVYVWLNMFWASARPSSGAYNCTRSLWFYHWREAAGALLVVVWQVKKIYICIVADIEYSFVVGNCVEIKIL